MFCDSGFCWVASFLFYLDSPCDSNAVLFGFVDVLRPIQHNWAMSSKASLPNHTFTGQA